MAIRHDITIDQGSNFKMTVEYRKPDNTGIPLTGYTFLFQVRDAPGGTVLANFSQYVSIDATTAGRILVNVPFTATDTLNFEAGVYDLVAIAPAAAERDRLIQGRAILSRKVSQ